MPVEDRRQGSRDHGEDSDGFEMPPYLLDPLGALERRWLWMLPVLVVGIVVTLAYVARMNPIYAATAKVLITRQQIPESFVKTTVVEDPLENINAMVGETVSLESLSRVIERFGLYGGGAALPMFDRIEIMRAHITIEQARGGRGNSLIYDVTFRHSNPETAAQVANALSALMIDGAIRRRGVSAERTTDFLKRALQEEERQLEEASSAVSAFRQEHRGTLPSELPTHLRRLEMLSERREAISARIASTENLISTLAAAGRMSESETLLDQLRRQLAAETAANTDAHPNVIALRERISRLERDVEREYATSGSTRNSRLQIASERRQVQLLREQLANIEAEIAELDARIDQVPKVAEELAILEQREDAQREAHLNAMRKVSDAETAESLETAQQGSRVKLLDSAQIPSKPERNRLKFLVFGLFASVMGALGLAVILEQFDPVVVNAEQIEAILGRPALGVMPRLG